MDNIVLIGRSVEETQKIIEELTDVTSREGLKQKIKKGDVNLLRKVLISGGDIEEVDE